MELGEILHNLVFDYTLRTVALGSGLLGIISGALGAFAVLRKQSLLGDSVSHTALPGIALVFLITGSKGTLALLIGAAIAGWLGTLLVMNIVRLTRIKMDSALGLVLSVFFGFGLVLLTLIQKMPNSRQAGLEKFLFGQASALLEKDVILMAVIGIMIFLVIALYWKEFKLISFDPEFGVSLGIPVKMIEIILTTILVVGIILGLQTVGVVLMSAMVVAPAAAARQWTDRLGLMVILSAFFGAIAGISGAVISSLATKIPTGPTIVIVISFIVLISMLFAPNRGLVFNWVRRRANRKKLALEAILLDLLELAYQHDNPAYPHSITTLQAMNTSAGDIAIGLGKLQSDSLVDQKNGNSWALTDSGVKRAEELLKEIEKR